MANIDDLFQLEGIVAVAQLDDMGKIVDWKVKRNVDPKVVKEQTSKWMMDIYALYGKIDRDRPIDWSPGRALIFSGDNMTLIVARNSAVTVENANANFGKLFNIFGIMGF